MRENGTNRTSGASLAVVGLAVAGTAAYGAFTKREEAGDHPNYIINGVDAYKFDLRLLAEGTGVAPVPTAPPAAHWLKFELIANGQPVHHRPVQFRKHAEDGGGQKLVTEHRWSGGYFYTFIRSGYRESKGPVNLAISFRERLVKELRLPPLPPSRRALAAVRTTPKWTGLTAEVVRTPNDANFPIGLRVDAPLKKDEALVIQPIGSTYLAQEPYGDPTFAKAGTFGTSRVVPLPVGYPRDADAVSVKAMRFRSRKVRHVLSFGLRYRGGTETDYHFSLRPTDNNLPDGLVLALSRFDRTVALPRDGSRPLNIYITGRQIAGRSRARLLSPSKVNGIDVRLGNRISSAEGVSESVQPPPNGLEIRTRGVNEEIPIRIEVELWRYEPVYEETIVVPFDFKTLPIEPKWNRYPLRYFG